MNIRAEPLRYPARLRRDGDAWMVTFPDLAVGVTHGASREEALGHAEDLLEEIVAGLMAKSLPVPRPGSGWRPPKSAPAVGVSALAAAKLGLYWALQDAGISKRELGRRLGWHDPQVARLFDLRHGSRLDQIETALKALGKRMVLLIDDAA